MGGDPVPGHHEILRDWHDLPNLNGRKRAIAISRLEVWVIKFWRFQGKKIRDIKVAP